jgi:chemotaxis protein methyltransferase CheR
MTAAPPPHADAPVLDDAAFARIARLARAEAGLALNASKRNMIASRIAKRLRATGHREVGAYLDALESDENAGERQNFVDVLTTNVSHFFREAHHFEILRREVLPALASRAARGDRVRIWSAGCSTGQEPYSIAMTVRETLGDGPARHVRVLATDIDNGVLDHAQRGVYSDRQLQGLCPERLSRHFRPVAGAPGAHEVRSDLRDMVAFRRLNLIADWPLRGPFDAIFCRNVVIYFDAETQADLWPRFRDLLAPDGVLFLGHSERLTPEVAAGLMSAGVTAFRSPGPAARGPAPNPIPKDVAQWQ